MSNTVTISRKRYEELLRKEARLSESEQRAELAELAENEELRETIKEQQKSIGFWARSFFDWVGWLQSAWAGVRELGSKLKHTERLMSNKNLEPEDRLYIFAAAEITQGSSKVDPAGRALARRDEVMRRAGLSRSTCYRVAKKLEEAGILDAKTYTRQTAQGTKKDRFEKLNQKALESPDCLQLPEKPPVENHHPSCQECESDDTIVKQQVVKTITCRDCGTMRTETMPPLITINPVYRANDADPHKSPCVNLKHGIKPGAKASGGSSA